MDNKHNSDISADELLAQLKANMAEGDAEEKSGTVKKYKFRRSGKITATVSEEDIRAHMPDNSDYSFESPVPKSEIEDLDIDELKEKGLWIFAAEAGGSPHFETDMTCAAAIILGSEGFGVSRLLKDKSDYIISIPMYGSINSLNVSTAGAVILCEAARQRNLGK